MREDLVGNLIPQLFRREVFLSVGRVQNVDEAEVLQLQHHFDNIWLGEADDRRRRLDLGQFALQGEELVHILGERDASARSITSGHARAISIGSSDAPGQVKFN